MDRDEFRQKTFERDSFKCVICKLPAKDAHHIMERRLWPDGGYALDNGASLCSGCHLKAESTEISCEDLWSAIGVKKVLPPHLYGDTRYDKWGNIIVNDYWTRLRGELADDVSVKRIIDTRLSWDETKEWAELLDLSLVPELYRGRWDEDKSRSCVKEGSEGYVVRISNSFKYADFRKYVAKFVRKGHVTTPHNWMNQRIVPNELK